MKQCLATLEGVADFSNLLNAYYRAKAGKSQRQPVAEFSLNLEQNLLALQKCLLTQTYRPSGYETFTIYERKPREIVAAPFVDRVVHHALIAQTEPHFDKQFIFDSYACRKDKGVHRAADRYQKWSAIYPYALKMDISKFFHSIDKNLLIQKLEKRVNDQRVIDLFTVIIQSYKPDQTSGLPIGNVTSQVLANVYLDDFDHFIKETLRVKGYLRYVDDFFLLAHSKQELNAYRAEVKNYIATQSLSVHATKDILYPTHLGCDVLGYKIWPHRRQLRNDNGFRFRRKLRKLGKKYENNQIEWPEIHASVRSWIGHAKHGDTLALRKSIFSEVSFCRG